MTIFRYIILNWIFISCHHEIRESLLLLGNSQPFKQTNFILKVEYHTLHDKGNDLVKGEKEKKKTTAIAMGWFGSGSKFSHLREIIRWNGGLKKSFIKLFYYDDLKIGRLVGTDQFGNKYYENNNYFYGRNRWVEYNLAWGLDYDASMIPPEWFGWLHYRTDYLPCNDPTRPTYPWQLPHIMNQSGTPFEYVPYDTTRDKIEAWVPPKAKPNIPNSCILKAEETAKLTSPPTTELTENPECNSPQNKIDKK